MYFFQSLTTTCNASVSHPLPIYVWVPKKRLSQRLSGGTHLFVIELPLRGWFWSRIHMKAEVRGQRFYRDLCPLYMYRNPTLAPVTFSLDSVYSAASYSTKQASASGNFSRISRVPKNTRLPLSFSADCFGSISPVRVQASGNTSKSQCQTSSRRQLNALGLSTALRARSQRRRSRLALNLTPLLSCHRLLN